MRAVRVSRCCARAKSVTSSAYCTVKDCGCIVLGMSCVYML